MHRSDLSEWFAKYAFYEDTLHISAGTGRWELCAKNQSTTAARTAFVAANEGNNETRWYLDSGAANHVTNDISNLSIKR